MTDPAPFITAFHRKSMGLKAKHEHVDFVSAFAADPDMVSAAQQELAQLQHRGAARDDFKGDHEGKIRHRALSRMLEQFDQRKAAP